MGVIVERGGAYDACSVGESAELEFDERNLRFRERPASVGLVSDGANNSKAKRPPPKQLCRAWPGGSNDLFSSTLAAPDRDEPDGKL